MVKIILALLVILIIVLVANELGTVNEGFIQCSDKSSYSWSSEYDPKLSEKKQTECKLMKGCEWKDVPGFPNSGNCLDECIAKNDKNCSADPICTLNSGKCQRIERSDEQDKLEQYFLSKQKYNEKMKLEKLGKNKVAKRQYNKNQVAAAAAVEAKRQADAAEAKRKTDAAKVKRQADAAVKAAKCNFVPWGDTIRSCIDRCASIEDRDYWGGVGCTDNKCYKICKKCTNNHCKWNDPVKIASVSGGIVPLKQVIKAIPSENKTEIKVMWRCNENDIKSFLIYFYKTYDSNNSVFTQKKEKNDNNNYIADIVENIEENQYYTIGICAVNNDNKVGPISNLERVKTDGLTSYF